MKGTVSKQTCNNWLIDAAVLIGAVIAAITGVYFLFLPSGGYQGGRNPMYGITISRAATRADATRCMALRSCSAGLPGTVCTPGSER
jgi:hypothetical protein